MDNALYVSLSRQITLQRALDVTANNVANLDTAGFKVEQVLLNTDPAAPPATPNQLIDYVLDAGLGRDFRQGAVEVTGNPYDAAIEGEGFFAIRTAQGVRYTRDGRFTTDAQNQLVDHQGRAVLDASGSPIVLDPTKGEPTIGRDGAVSQGTVKLARLGVTRFANLSDLSKDGDNLYAAGANAQPVVAADAVVRQGAVEKSNVQPVLEITNLIQISRAYERVAQLMNDTQNLSFEAVQRLGKAA